MEVQRADLVSNFIGDTAGKTSYQTAYCFHRLLFINILLANKMRFPYGIEGYIVKCFDSISSTVRSENNASLCSDLLREVQFQQEARLNFDSTIQEVTKYEEADFQHGIMIFRKKHLLCASTKKEFRDNSTRTKHEVMLHISGVGMVPGSPFSTESPWSPCSAVLPLSSNRLDN